MTTSTSTIRRNRLKKIIRILSAAVFWLGLWAVLALRTGQELILPGPLSVLRELEELAGEKSFWLATGMSLWRIFSGFLIALALGTVIAVLTSASGIMDAIFSPMMRLMRAVPVASFIVLALLWVGKSEVPRICVLLMVAPIAWANVSTAIEQTDARLLEMARAYRFGRWKTVRHIYAPSVLPSWRSACITGVGLAWKAGIAAEVLCLPKNAVGAEIYYSKIYLETPALFAWTAVVIVLSFVLEKLIALLVRGRKKA